jgi:succinylglutamate desuccinylase
MTALMTALAAPSLTEAAVPYLGKPEAERTIVRYVSINYPRMYNERANCYHRIARNKLFCSWAAERRTRQLVESFCGTVTVRKLNIIGFSGFSIRRCSPT